ncbi:MAG: hypothetical protein JSW54_03345 [Fidelibacterota bacterium]|nr:MAG: hypothetical protein JSW54_03345 [Candidatus Neomarinimicrobiota bacterium]
MIIRIIITTALVFSLASDIFAQEQKPKNLHVMVGVTGGVSQTNYDGEWDTDPYPYPINYQLRVKGLAELANYYYPYGVGCNVIYKDRLVINGSFSSSYTERKWEASSTGGVSFLRSALLGKVGLIPFSGSKNLLYPYLGLASESMKVRSDFSTIIKEAGFWINGRGVDWISHLDFIYGIEYIRLPRKGGKLGFGMEIGNSIALTPDRWEIEGERSVNSRLQAAPVGFFAKGHVYFLLFTGRF